LPPKGDRFLTSLRKNYRTMPLQLAENSRSAIGCIFMIKINRLNFNPARKCEMM